MPSPLEQAGALAGPSKYAPLHTNRFFTGLWTQRNPLRDAATPFLYEKFYSGTRFDSLIDGLNAEISSRLTIRRRPGNSVYNAQTFTPINRFYEFRVFSTTDEIIHLMADTDTTVYDATGPALKKLIFTKSAGAGSTYFQSVGNILMFGNGVDERKWVQSTKSWLPLTTFAQGDYFIDASNNIQVATGAASVDIVNVSISGNICTINTKTQVPFLVSHTVTLQGLTAAAFLNGQAVRLLTRTYNQFSFAFVHADYASAADTGTASIAGGPTGIIGPFDTPAAWGHLPGAITIDGSEQWICKGPSVQKHGIASPTVAPMAVNVDRPVAYELWAANTVYSNSLVVVDGNGNIQKLTTGGTTGGAEPVWSVVVGGVTPDNTASWTNMGTATRAIAHAYAVGDLIYVAWTYWITIQYQGRYGPGTNSYQVNQTGVFRCKFAGISGGTTPTWQDGIGSLVTDGGVTWENIGRSLTWVGGIGPATKVSVQSVVLDSNGYKQQVLTPGKSGAVAPAWATQSGATTADGTMVWQNAGSYSTAGVFPKFYAFAYKNKTTGQPSTSSPMSLPLVIGANKVASIQGAASTDPQVDTIEIYATKQNGSVLMFLDEIPNPGTGVFTYIDGGADDALNPLLTAAIADQNDPPPVGAINHCYHLGRLFVSVGNVASFSSTPNNPRGNGVESFPPANEFVFPSHIYRYWSTPIGLIVFTARDAYVILGQGTTASPFYPVMFLEKVGILSYDAFTVFGSTAYLMTYAGKVISLDPGAGVTEVGFAIGDQFENTFDPSSARLTWHEQSSSDSALYVGDGATGWFRMSATAAPETGFTWSPRAIVTGGCRAIMSTRAGLLIGPGIGGGNILVRDKNVRTDGAALSTYVWNYTIGSIVLAQPGQIAEIEFVTIDSVRVGTRPIIGVLLGEISGRFDKAYWNKQDPPLLPPSDTTYNDRYYMAQNMNPTFCRHFQLQFSWAAEDAASEVLSYTIYGAIHHEQQ
jgi:hypothetical protein